MLEIPRLVPLRGGLGAVPGVRLAGVHAGIKPRRRDLALIAFEAPQVCAAVVTTNDIQAAPVRLSTAHLHQAGGRMRALVCNSGCANACTGDQGERDALATAIRAAGLIGAAAEEVVVASTGVIGVPLPMAQIERGLARAASLLEYGNKAAHDAAEAIMTTDRTPKLAAYSFYEGSRKYVVGGIAKGSGMIAPNMATMLAFIATDLPVPREALQGALREAADGSFNMISVDGDMSTNDAVYCFAPAAPAADAPPPGFGLALAQVCHDLAVAMVADGEGATKTITMHVTDAATIQQARAIARAVVNSSLVKTALYGEDPNWGRIYSAAGAARTGIRAEAATLLLNGRPWVLPGTREALSEAEAHRELEHADITLELQLAAGGARATAWGCDLSKDYVRINASYRT